MPAFWAEEASTRVVLWEDAKAQLFSVFTQTFLSSRWLKHLLPSLSGHHVLVRVDNATTVVYINHQGGLHSRVLHTLAQKLIFWSSGPFLSMRVTHLPGILSTGADLLSRGAPMYWEWILQLQVMELLYRRAHFAAQAVSSTGPDTPTLVKVRGYTQRLHTGPCCTGWRRYIRCWVPSLGSCQHRGPYLCNGGTMFHLSDSNCRPGPWAGPTPSKMPGLPPLNPSTAVWIVFDRMCLEGDHISFSVFCGGNTVVCTGVKHLSLLLAGLACQGRLGMSGPCSPPLLSGPLGVSPLASICSISCLATRELSNRETPSRYFEEESFTIYHNHSS